jgi:hypothetical protein
MRDPPPGCDDLGMDPNDPAQLEQAEAGDSATEREGAEQGAPTTAGESDPEPPHDPYTTDHGWLPV